MSASRRRRLIQPPTGICQTAVKLASSLKLFWRIVGIEMLEDVRSSVNDEPVRPRDSSIMLRLTS